MLGQRLFATEPSYPCHFGIQGQLNGQNWITGLDPTDASWSLDELAASLRAYRTIAWQGAKRKSLVVFVGPPHDNPDLAEDTTRFWDVLRELSRRDDVAWPGDQPRDPRDPRWQWCFAAEPWFVLGCSPAYRTRRSRDLGPCLTLVFQTRRVFDGLSGSSIAGQAAKRQVRAAIDRHDDLPVHPHLGHPLHSSIYKWRQYMIPDDEQVFDEAACPFADVVAGRDRA